MTIKNKLFFVCTANRFRSVMAEHIMTALLTENPIAGLIPDNISSAGVLPDAVWEKFQKFLKINSTSTLREEYYGLPALRDAIDCLLKKGQDVSSQTSRPLRAPLAKEARLIITMQQVHMDELLKRYPFLDGKIISMRELSRETSGEHRLYLEESFPKAFFDLDDPQFVAYDEEYTERVYNEIHSCLKTALPYIRNAFSSTCCDKKE